LSTRFKQRFGSKKKLKSEVRTEVVKVLKSLEIPDPERVADMYPHELSGGMAQRSVIAMAPACNPKVLIADEPTINLDVTIQAQILNPVRLRKENFNSSLLYITHDLDVVAQHALTSNFLRPNQVFTQRALGRCQIRTKIGFNEPGFFLSYVRMF